MHQRKNYWHISHLYKGRAPKNTPPPPQNNDIFFVRKKLTWYTSGTDWTGPRPDGPAIGSFGWPESDDIFGLVMPLATGKPLDVDVHVDVVVALLYELLPNWATDVELLFAPRSTEQYELNCWRTKNMS